MKLGDGSLSFYLISSFSHLKCCNYLFGDRCVIEEIGLDSGACVIVACSQFRMHRMETRPNHLFECYSLSIVGNRMVFAEGDKTSHHPAGVYPQSFSHDDVVEVLELKPGKEVTHGKHQDLSESNTFGMDKSWSESGSTCSDHGEDHEQCDHHLSKDSVEIEDKNMSDLAKVIICCKDNTTCVEVKDICIDEGALSDMQIASEKEKDTVTASAEEDLIDNIRVKRENSTPNGHEDLVEADGEGDTNVLATEIAENGSVAFNVDAPATSSRVKDETSKDRSSANAVNQDKSKADTASNRQPESLEGRHDQGESSFSYAGPVSGSVTYSGPKAFSGSLSLRSDSSTTSTRSFAFPILQNEWNSSPVRMAKGDRGRLRKHRAWKYGLLCCRF